MKRRLLWEDLKQNKIRTLAAGFFFGASALAFGLAIFLFVSLLGSIHSLMELAQVPDFLQMHSGTFDLAEVEAFAKAHDAVEKWQISPFLNLENGLLFIGDASLSENTQDNGICVQNEDFDFLLDLNNERIKVNPGEVYVPVCMRDFYDIQVEDTMLIGTYPLKVVGFLRDAQMNSMMASSKRFLVHPLDYERLKPIGSEEYLIEFKLREDADAAAFATDYAENRMPSSGPTITAALIRLMNALSDGVMILVILLVSVILFGISLLCIRFLVLTGLEQEKREIGTCKALGIPRKDIRLMLFAKYVILSAVGLLLGFGATLVLAKPLSAQMETLYGPCMNRTSLSVSAFLAILLEELLLLASVRKLLKKAEQVSAVEALFGESMFEKSRRKYLLVTLVVAAGMFLMILPANMKKTIASPDFVTYMGIGSGQVRIDIRQTEQIEEKSAMLNIYLKEDEAVCKSVLLVTQNLYLVDETGNTTILTVEIGDHECLPISYAKGRAPVRSGEIALSMLNAEDYRVELGDCLMTKDGEKLTVVGIYSDITNGGKTAKASSVSQAGPVLWSIFYVALSDEVDLQEWMEQSKRYLDGEMSGDIKWVDIAHYLKETYGQTIAAIEKACVAAKGISLLVVFVVILLFLNLLMEQKRGELALMRALGLSRRQMWIRFVKGTLLSMLGGILAGLILADTLGQVIVGKALEELGATGFTFRICPQVVLIEIPCMMLVTCLLAAFVGARGIHGIQAYECLREERN